MSSFVECVSLNSSDSPIYKSSDVKMPQQTPQRSRLLVGSNEKSTATDKSTNHVTFQRAFRVFYSGYAVLDRRYTLPMLPWLVAEIKRHGSQNEEEIFIEVTEQSLKAVSCINKTTVFEHKLQTISKFAQSSQDPSCFTYMTRDVASGPCAYHVFQATDENAVMELFTSMREMSKEMSQVPPLLVRTASGSVLDSVISSCQQYEVLYLGRIKVSGKRAPPAFIDDAVEKFRIFNHPSYYKRKRHGSGASVSSLLHSLESEDLSSSSSGIVSLESSVSAKSLEGSIHQIYCDTGNAFHSSQTSIDSLEQGHKPTLHSQPFVPHSQSMDFAASKPAKKVKSSEFHHTLMPPSSLITHTQSLDTPGCADIVRDLRDSDPGVKLRDRVRSCSGDIPRAKQISLPSYPKNEAAGFVEGQRPRAYTSPSSPEDCQSNRTMLFIIGRMEICLIGTDKKQMLLSKTFNDIAHCSQGVKNLDHFGFICRETTLSGAECYSGYIFKCQTEKVVDEMMQTLKLAFSKAHQNYQKSSDSSPSSRVFICDTCPMHWFHRLCSAVEGMPPENAQLTILQRVSFLSDANKEKIISKFQHSSNCPVQEQNEILMTLLREFSEQKQRTHSHTLNSSATSKIDSSDKDSKLLAFKEKARRSFTSSLESFRKLTNRDDSKESSIKAFFEDKKSGRDYDARSVREGSYDSQLHTDQTSISSRPRSSTFSSTREKHLPTLESSHRMPFKPVIESKGPKDPRNIPSPGQSELKGSWRQAIFQKVQSPRNDAKKSSSFASDSDEFDVFPVFHLYTKKSPKDYRALWKKAINEQIILIRMENENKKLQANQDAICHKRLKLDYEDVTPCIKSNALLWEKLLAKSRQCDEALVDMEELTEMVKDGVPRHKRGEIWLYLTENNRRLRRNNDYLQEMDDVPYEHLLKQLTSHQHGILIDIGRTFPSHPYYAQKLGSGQLSLFNLLKAYSLLDPEVGYCQGLSFVAGILLLHLPEKEAFSMLKYLMFDLGMRRQYKNDMVAFQVQMYQLTRLIHDNHRDLFYFLEKLDIAPTLYAAPWFLTLCASQFSVGFVARLFDLIFLFGMDVVFKVSLILLGKFKDAILSCDGFESALNYLKHALPAIDILHSENVFAQVFNLDISRQLHAFEVEYHMLAEEMVCSPSEDSEELKNLRTANKQLKAQNMEIMEQLQVAYSRIHVLESSESSLKAQVARLERTVARLRGERDGLLRGLSLHRNRLEQGGEGTPPFGVVYAGSERRAGKALPQSSSGSESEEDDEMPNIMKDFYRALAKPYDGRAGKALPQSSSVSKREEDDEIRKAMKDFDLSLVKPYDGRAGKALPQSSSVSEREEYDEMRIIMKDFNLSLVKPYDGRAAEPGEAGDGGDAGDGGNVFIIGGMSVEDKGNVQSE